MVSPTLEVFVPEEFSPLIPESTTADLARLRKVAKLSQEKLAEEIGVTRVSLLRWEAGTQEPPSEKLDAAINRLDELIGENVLPASVGRRLEKLRQRHRKAHPETFETLMGIWELLDVRLGLALILLAGLGATEMVRVDWVRLFQVRPHIFDGLPSRRLPTGAEYLLGIDVGVAMDASLRGMSYTEWTDRVGGIRGDVYEDTGEFQLEHQLQRVFHEFEITVGNLPSTEDEVARFKPQTFEDLSNGSVDE